MPRPAGSSLLDPFSALQDPRQQAKVLYPLPEILLLLLCATLAGADDLVEIELWGQQQLAFLRRFRPFARGIPSHDTPGAVLGALDPALFKARFTSWVEGPREAEPDLVASDGKTARRGQARSKGREPLPLVSARATRQRLVLGQEAVAVAGPANEITAIPRLLERLALEGALVTIDAIGTRSAIAAAIRAPAAATISWRGKGTARPAMLEGVAAFFADPPPGMVLRHETLGKGHGRLETRRHAVRHEVAWLFSDRRYPDEPAFPDLAMIGIIESETERGGKVARERRYFFLSSARLDPEACARAVRGHGGIEDRLHGILDAVFRDDLSRLRRGHAPANMAVVEPMALNLLRQAKPTTSLKNRRKLAAWSLDYLDRVIRGAA